MHNIIIIGGGPAGLSAAVYTARAGLKPVVFAGSPPGGQLMLTSEVENFPGYQNILGPVLIEMLRKQAKAFGTKIIDDNITSVDFNTKLVVATTKRAYVSKSIIIATGAQALWLGLDSEQKLLGKGVSACATCDGFFFKNKDVAVVGGGDTALEEAQTLTRFAKKIYIIHRKDNFRASKIMQERVMNNPKIHIIWNSIIKDILGEIHVQGLRIQTISSDKTLFKKSLIEIQKITPNISQSKIIRKTNTSVEWEIPINGIFIAIGHKPDTDIFKDYIKLDKKGYILTSAMVAQDTSKLLIDLILKQNSGVSLDQLEIRNFNPTFQSMTSVPGVFAAGDCVDYIYRQAGTAAGRGIEAALDAQRYLEEK